MALIITSNVNLDDKPDTSNVFKPYSYTNHLTSTMKIPPNSQIALQSAKINKNGTFQINRENSTFTLYFGEVPATGDTNLDSFASAPTYGTIGNITGDDVQSLTPSDTAVEIQKGMNEASYHPFVARHITVEVSRDISTKEFQGFKYTFNQQIANTLTAPTQNFTDKRQIPLRNATFTNSVNGTLTNAGAGDNYFYAVYDRQPMSLSPSSFGPDVPSKCVFDITGGNLAGTVNCAWRVGLTRWNRERPSDETFAPIYYEARSGGSGAAPIFETEYYDYVVYRVSEFLRVAQVCNYKGEGGTRMNEVEYWGATRNFTERININTNREKYTHIKFEVDGEKVWIYIYDDDAAGWVELIGDNQGGGIEKTPVPLSQAKWCLYPAMGSKKNSVSLSLDSYDTPNNINDLVVRDNPKYDWWVKLQDEGLERWASDIEERPWNRMGGGGGVEKSTLLTVDSGGFMGSYKNGILTAPSRIYGFSYTLGNMASRVLGLEGRNPAFTGGDLNGTQAITSSTVPKLVSDVSLFIRLNNFDQQCVNAKQGSNHSKIIAHLPRFDNSGNDVGGLYFEPHERTYIDLHNTNDMFINSFDLDIVYDNEQLCKSIAGKTIIVLHIKQKNK